MLIVTPIKNNNNLLNTINSYIKLRKLKEVMLLCRIIKLLSISSADKYSKKHLKVCEADALKQVDANIREEENKNYSSLYYSNSNSNTAIRKTRIKASQLRKASKEEELAKTKKEKREKELIGAYILYFKELLSNNSKIFASVIGITRTQAIVLLAIIEYKNKVVAIDSINSILCDLSNLLVIRFCIFSNSALENIGILTNKEVVEMQTNTATALANKLTAVNKLIILEANMPTVHSKATKHYSALFRKVDKHIFRAYNTISVIAQRMIIRKGGLYIEKKVILLSSYFNATNKRDSVTSDRIYKIEDTRNIIANVKHDASKHKSSYKDILEKEGLNKLEASRRVIFNCFKIQVIASYFALTTLKAAQFKTYSSYKVKRFTLNSVKDLFTNLSKDYFLSIAAEDTVKAANILLLLKKVCAKILIELYKLIVQAIIVALIAFAEAITLIEATHVVIIELQDSIVYFNLDSKLKLKVLDKQDVKTTF
ncbi:hypothetical protein HBH73_140830 [Parastagonospora nodorum]|nr:hypothetical protein HBH73_140830 [Parastagonospora nodorum]